MPLESGFELEERVIIKLGSESICYGRITWIAPDGKLFRIELLDGRTIFALNGKKWCKYNGTTSYKAYKLRET